MTHTLRVSFGCASFRTEWEGVSGHEDHPTFGAKAWATRVLAQIPQGWTNADLFGPGPDQAFIARFESTIQIKEV